MTTPEPHLFELAPMTWRARVYLVASTIANLYLATLCVFFPYTFQSPTFVVVVDGAPLVAYGVAFAASAVFCAAGGLRGSANLARVGAAGSFFIYGMWALGLTIGAIAGNPTGYTGPMIWTLAAVYHGLQTVNPMRLPLEPVIRSMGIEPREDR